VTTVTAVTFREWIDDLVEHRFGGRRTALANAIGLQLTVFIRGLKAGTFSVLNCLRLAKATNTDPLLVLRLAGKHEVAALIEELCVTTGTKAAVTDKDRFHLRRWHSITARAQQGLDLLIDDLVRDDALRIKSRKVRRKRSA
jgi:hypothetical protein